MSADRDDGAVVLTPTLIDAGIRRNADLRRLNSEAEAEHYRLMNMAGRQVEVAGATIDELLDMRVGLNHAEDPLDPTDPAEVAAIAQAWAGSEPETDVGHVRAVLALRLLAAMVPVVGGVQELPGLIQDAHGCWVTDRQDPVAATAGVGLGCEEAW